MLLGQLNRAFHYVSKTVSRTVPLPAVLILPFALQTLATVGLVGYFSFKHGQQTVKDLSGQLRSGITNRIEEKLKTYTEIPHTINRFNAIAFAENNIDVDNAQGEYQFWQQTLMFPSTSLIYCSSNRTGAVLGTGRLAGENSLQLWVSNATTGNIPHFYSLNSQGERDRLLGRDTKRFDARLRPWYQAAVATGQPTWSEIYSDFTTGLPTLTASVPIYDSTHQELRGVCATDFFLPQEMNQFLESLEIGKSGIAFIMERSGLLVSTSIEQLSEQDENVNQRLNAIDSENQTIQATAIYLRDRFGQFEQIQSSYLLNFKVNGQRQFVQVLPFQDPRGLDWLIVTVLPETDFMERIHANTRITVLLCITTLIVGAAISILTARWITRPLVSLSRSAKALTKGEWDQTVKIERSGDLGELAASFNEMADQLQTSFIELQSLNAALSQNESRLKQFLEAVPVGIAVLDAAGHPYYANQRAIQLLGKGSISSVTPEAIAEIYQIYRAGTQQHYPAEALPIVSALRGERAAAEDLEIHHSDRMIALEAWGTPIVDEMGNVTYALAAFQDITQRKQAEQLLADYHQTLEHQIAHRTTALRASEEKFASAFRASPVAMGILTLPDGQYMDVNDSFCQTMGYPREQVIGRTCADLNLWKHPEDRIRIFKMMAETGSLRDQEVEFRHQSGETLIIRGSGEQITVDGTPCILSIYENVTERKRVEVELRRSEAKFRRFFESNLIGAIVADLNGSVVEANDAFLNIIGYTQDDICSGKVNWSEITPSEYVHDDQRAVEELKTHGVCHSYEKEYYCKNGNRVPVLIGYAVLQENQQSAIGFVLDLRPQRAAALAERKQAEANSILEERTRFAREIHDTLAQAFTGIIMQMETAKVVIPTDSKARTLIDTAHDLAREGLAEARRSVWALRPPRLEQEGLSRTLQNLVDGITTGTPLQAQCQIQAPPYPLPCDIETNLLRIVQEATTNVLKHANASTILVELTFDFQALRLRIQDNGDGFDPDCHHSLGFGLVGMRERVQNLGGQLMIMSQRGQGTEIVAIVFLVAPLPCGENSL